MQRVAAAERTNPELVSTKLPPAARARYFAVLYRYAHLLAMTLEDLSSPAQVEPMVVRTFGQPVTRPPIRLPPKYRDFLRTELAAARSAGLVCTGASPWSAPSFVVPKPWSTKLRVVLDYRWLNAQTIRDSYPLPHVPEVLEAVG